MDLPAMMKWMFVAVLAFAGGLFLVNYLTVHPLQMSLQLLLALLCVFLVVVLLAVSQRGKALLLGIVVAVLSFGLGYTLRANAVLAREDSRFVPELTRAVGDPGDGHSAVVYFTHGEPETYNPIGWLNQFREFDKQDIPFVPLVARPIFIYQLRNAYLQVGQSHHRQMHLQMARRLEETLRAAGYPDLKVYPSFLDDDPRPDAALIQALNEGASEIVVAEVFVSISNHTAEGEEQIHEVGGEAYGATIAFTGPLWDSATLHRAFLEKANAAIGDTDPADVGVLLVGHGQPDEWDREFATETEHELEFRRRVLELLAENGYDRENMGLAWMEFKQPKPAKIVEELVGRGVEKIIYFSAAISADSIHSQYDVPELIHEADVPEGIPLINLGAWNDHPLVIEAIKERVLEQLASE
ncbi:MAG: ferrochelatase [Anaerolineae bacterium]|jgi:protoheme ferro-lyase|nr:ferrochelatase [Anaerolineae bacterium]